MAKNGFGEPGVARRELRRSLPPDASGDRAAMEPGSQTRNGGSHSRGKRTCEVNGNEYPPSKARLPGELGKLRAFAARSKGRNLLRKILALFVFVVGSAAPAAAHPSMGMTAMQYYVGTWSCVAGNVGQPPVKATATYTIDSGLMHQSVVVPPQGKMTKAYVLSIATSYDAKKGRYVEAQLDNMADWTVSFLKPWTGNTEKWTDQSSSTGKLSHSQTVRTNQNSFAFMSYPSMTSMKPNFKGTCTRSS